MSITYSKLEFLIYLKLRSTNDTTYAAYVMPRLIVL